MSDFFSKALKDLGNNKKNSKSQEVPKKSISSAALSIGSSIKTNAISSKKSKHEVSNIIEFVESDWGVGFTLYPVQKFILKVYYGLELESVEKIIYVSDNWRRKNIIKMTEVEYLQYLYDNGKCNVSPATYEVGVEKEELILSIGRRSGKTLLSSCIAAYETYRLISKGDPQTYYGTPVGKDLQLISVATDKDQAGLLYQDVAGHFRKCKFFRQYQANNTMSYARFQTPKDIELWGSYKDDDSAKASIKVTFKSCIAKGLRGAANIVVILDEVAHFIDSGQSSAEAVMQAVGPSTKTFMKKDPITGSGDGNPLESKVVLISSPLGKQGLFYNRFHAGMKGGLGTESVLCVQAPTWEVNPTIPSHVFEMDYLTDPNVFFTEFGAVFTDRTKGWIEREEDLLSCISQDRRKVSIGITRQPYFVGIDFALAGDATAVAIGHLEKNKIILDYIGQIKAGLPPYEDKDRLEFEEVSEWVYKLSRKFYFTDGMFDQWSGIIFEQALHKKGLRQIKMVNTTKQLNSQMFRNFKDLMWNEKIELYDPKGDTDGMEKTYIEELLTLQAEYHSKYITTVEAPSGAGNHDDRSDALIRMVWTASQHLAKGNYVSDGRSGNHHGGVRVTDSMLRKLRKKSFRSGSHPDRMIPRGRRR